MRDGRINPERDTIADHAQFGRIVALTTEPRILPGFHANSEVLDDRLTMLNDHGRPERVLSLYDLFKKNEIGFELKPVTAAEKGGVKGIDLFHINTVTPLGLDSMRGRGDLFAPANVLITLRHQNTLAVIDLDTKRLAWAWGQGELDGPHDGTLLKSGHFLVVDNGLTRGWSRVLEVDPSSREIVWQYPTNPDKSLFTKSYGAAQRLDNGDTLVTDSDSGRAIEVTPKGNVVWEFYNPTITAKGERNPVNGVRRYTPTMIEPLLKRGP